MAHVLLVGIGGMIGTLSRYFLGFLLAQALPFSTYSTIVINLLGSFAIGIFLAIGQERLGSAWSLIVPGILGGFTTFSAFSGEVVLLLKNELYSSALIYAVLSVLGGVLLAGLAFAAAKMILDGGA